MSRSAYARRLVVMVKEPRAGRVKTRLARGVGVVQATTFYRHATATVLSRVTRPHEWQTILAVAPDSARRSPAWNALLARIPQGSGDLGARMQRVMDELPAGPVLIIGSDIAGIRAGLIREAFRKLGSQNAVFGPCSDGGYWLVGLKRFPHVPRAFGNVRWSSKHALADTVRNLAGRRVAEIETLDDVDEAEDLTRTGGGYGRCVRSARVKVPNQDP